MPPWPPSKSSSVCSTPSLVSSGGEGLSAQIQIPLVAAAGVEVDPAHAPQRLGVVSRHPHRIKRQPPPPDGFVEAPGRDLERKQSLTRPIRVRGVGAGVSVELERLAEL